MNPFPLILSSPSGGGKTTIARLLLENRRDVGYSVSCTTRAPRNGEVDCRDYQFLSVEEFESRQKAGAFAEWAFVHGHRYGTLRSEVERVLQSGRHVLMDVDVRGAALFKEAFPESVRVFLLPPSAEVLFDRLTGRQTELTDEVVGRLQRALDELREVPRYEYVIVNDDLTRAVGQVAAIIDAEAVRHARLPNIADQVAALIADLGRRLSNPH